MKAIKIEYNGKVGKEMVLKRADSSSNPTKTKVLSTNKTGGLNLITPKTAKTLLNRLDKFNDSEEKTKGVRLRLFEDGFRMAKENEVDWFIKESHNAGKPVTKLPRIAGPQNVQFDEIKSENAELKKEIAELKAMKAGIMPAPMPVQPIAPKPEAEEKETIEMKYPEGFEPPFPNPTNGGQVGSNTRAFNKWKKANKEGVGA